MAGAARPLAPLAAAAAREVQLQPPPPPPPRPPPPRAARRRVQGGAVPESEKRRAAWCTISTSHPYVFCSAPFLGLFHLPISFQLRRRPLAGSNGGPCHLRDGLAGSSRHTLAAGVSGVPRGGWVGGKPSLPGAACLQRSGCWWAALQEWRSWGEVPPLFRSLLARRETHKFKSRPSSTYFASSDATGRMASRSSVAIASAAASCSATDMLLHETFGKDQAHARLQRFGVDRKLGRPTRTLEHLECSY